MADGKVAAYLILTLGIVLMLVGAAFVLIYLLEAVVARIGQDDQSLLFWYLPILFLGSAGFVFGLSVFLKGLARRKED